MTSNTLNAVPATVLETMAECLNGQPEPLKSATTTTPLHWLQMCSGSLPENRAEQGKRERANRHH